MALRALMLVVGLAAAAPSAQVARDAAGPPPVGAARVAGVVTSDEPKPVPLRHAIVSLSNGRDVGRVMASDESGRFLFENVPEGRYTLTANKGGYLPGAYGSTVPGSAGTPLVIAAGGQANGLKIAMTRGAVITGVLRDDHGTPVEGLRVWAVRPGTRVNERTGEVSAASGSSSITDDRGSYRIFGLSPGSYVVYVTAPLWISAGTTRLTAREDVQRAQRLVDAATAGGTAPPAAAPQPVGATVTYANSYYPRTVAPGEAAVLQLRAGEERGGIDLHLILATTAGISGRVVDVSGQPVANPVVWIRPAVPGGTRDQFEMRTQPDGTFSVASLQAGRYDLGAQGRAGADRTLWARLTISVADRDQSDLVLQLQPGLQVSGRLIFDGDATPPPASSIGVTLFEAGQTSFHSLPSAKPATDGTFTIEGIAAARYRINIGELTGRLPAGWMVKSITAPGTDIDHADVPIEVVVGRELPPLTVTLTSRTTELSGTLQDSAGRPAPAFTMVAFTTDTTAWGGQSRRVQSTRPADDGKFSFMNLPAGDYFLAAVNGMESGQANDAQFLSTLVAGATRVTIAAGQKTVQDLKIR